MGVGVHQRLRKLADAYTDSVLPQISVPSYPAQDKNTLRGMVPPIAYTKVNASTPPTPDAGSVAQKSLYPMGSQSLPKTAQAIPFEDPTMNMKTRPLVQDLVKQAMDNAARRAQIASEGARQMKLAEDKCPKCEKNPCECEKDDEKAEKKASGSITTDYAMKLAAAVEYAVPSVVQMAKRANSAAHITEQIQQQPEGVSHSAVGGTMPGPGQQGKGHHQPPTNPGTQKAMPQEHGATQLENTIDEHVSGEQTTAMSGGQGKTASVEELEMGNLYLLQKIAKLDEDGKRKAPATVRFGQALGRHATGVGMTGGGVLGGLSGAGIGHHIVGHTLGGTLLGAALGTGLGIGGGALSGSVAKGVAQGMSGAHNSKYDQTIDDRKQDKKDAKAKEKAAAAVNLSKAKGIEERVGELLRGSRVKPLEDAVEHGTSRVNRAINRENTRRFTGEYWNPATLPREQAVRQKIHVGRVKAYLALKDEKARVLASRIAAGTVAAGGVGTAVAVPTAIAVNHKKKHGSVEHAVDDFLDYIKQAEDAINPAQISAGPAVPPDTNASGEPGGQPVGGAPSGPHSLIHSNDAAINFKRQTAYAPRKSELAAYFSEPALSAATDKTLNEAFAHTGEAGVKISAAQLVKSASARALLTKLAADSTQS